MHIAQHASSESASRQSVRAVWARDLWWLRY